ncbi:MAG TPA: hypothetical protein VJ488_05850 [Dehalococcoidia bacterium]|nr:hypothetical protein [Dehalococcoidia bacterium]
MGSNLKVSGRDFAGTLATISLDGRVVAKEIPMAVGDFEYTTTIPEAIKGTHTVEVTDNSNWAGSSAEAEFTVTPSIKLFPGVIESNTSFTVYGYGFEANEIDIKISLDGKDVMTGHIDANRFGSWTATISVPTLARGRHTVSVHGSSTAVSELTQLSLIVAPYAEVSPDSGPVGTQLMIYAWGFRHNEDGLTITLDNKIIKTNVEAENDGSLILDGSPRPTVSTIKGKGDTYESVFVPPTTRGDHSIGVYGSSFTPRGTFPDHIFTVTPGLTLNPDKGKKADIIQITGTGFSKDEKITLQYGDSEVRNDLIADATGTFELEFVIPQVNIQETIFSAAGNQGNTAQMKFSLLQSSSNVVPVLLEPVNGQTISIFDSVGDVYLGVFNYLTGLGSYLKGRANQGSRDNLTALRWALAGENLQLHYILQISSNPRFDTVDVERNVSGGTEYYLTRTDGLATGNYYWHVKGIDINGNTTEWSDTAQFQIAPIQTQIIIISWVILILVIVAIVFIFILIKANIKKYRY